MMCDLRFALRTLARAPGYAGVSILTLALGIGAVATIFAVVNGVLLKPLPYAEPDRLVRVHQASPERGLTDGALSPIDFEDWRAQARSFSAIAAYWTGLYTLTGLGDATEIRASFVTEDFFEVLRTPVLLGRPLTPDDLRQAAQVAVISERLWRGRLGADPAVVGRLLELGGVARTVVGVVASDLGYPAATNEAWLPQTLITEDSHGPQVRENRYLEAVGRLAPGITAGQAEAELSGIAARLEAEYGASNDGWSAASVVPLREVLVGAVDRPLVVVFAVVLFVLLIGCVNLANLMLARATGRTREFAVRSALGAGRWPLVRQLSTEAMVLALAGGLLGLALAAIGIEAVIALSADTLPRVEDVRLDLRTVLVALGAAVLASLTFGLLPGLRVASSALALGLRSGRGTVGAARGGLRNALVVTQVMFAVLLVLGAGLMIRSFLALNAVDPGFDPDRVLTVSMSVNVPADINGTPNETPFILRRKAELVARAEALPGVVSAATIHRLPLQALGEPWEFTRADAPDGQARLRADARFVSSGYFTTMGIPLRAGEVFAEHRPGAPLSVIVSESAARRLWGTEDPLGEGMRLSSGQVLEVTGVVGDVRQFGLAAEPQPAVYVSQALAPRSATTLVLRTTGDPRPLAGPVRAFIAEMDPNQPVRSILTLGEVMAESLGRERFFTLLFGAFGALALALAVVGIYGVLAYMVSQRRREIGVRIALGAGCAAVVRMVLGFGMTLVGAGIALGLLAAFALTRVLSGLLYGVTHTDPATFVSVPVLLCAVALLAAWVPARRATRVDPMEVIRSE
ncbi:MAG TPA: ABC transporter permease [Gammaproteobacteria bacterium]|nr:ABC transporter permease [Gammaproteobacteria bacterium]